MTYENVAFFKTLRFQRFGLNQGGRSLNIQPEDLQSNTKSINDNCFLRYFFTFARGSINSPEELLIRKKQQDFIGR